MLSLVSETTDYKISVMRQRLIKRQLEPTHVSHHIETSPLNTDAGRNSLVRVEIGESKFTVKMADLPESIGSLRLTEPILVGTIKFIINGVHSSKNNGFEKIHIWTRGIVEIKSSLDA